MKNPETQKNGLSIIDMINAEILKHENDTDEQYWNSQESNDANEKIHNLVDQHLFVWENDDDYVQYCLRGTLVENYKYLINKIFKQLKKQTMKTETLTGLKYKAVWTNTDELAINSYDPSEQVVDESFFSEKNGYEQTDISAIQKLKLGETYNCSYGNHSVTVIK